MNLQQLFMLFPIILLLLILVTAAAVDSEAKPECLEKCGNVSIPYPFGVGNPRCYKHTGFELICNYNFTPPVLLAGNIPVVNISLQQGTSTVLIDMAFDCHPNSEIENDNSDEAITLTDTPYTFSHSRNKFTAIGCDTLALMEDADEKLFGSGCVSMCNKPLNATDDEVSCSGVGCCQTPIPKGLKTLNMSLSSINDHKYTWQFNPCSYAFLADQDWFDFSKMDLSNLPDEMEDSQVVLDWVVGTEGCESAQTSEDPSSYACGLNSNCSNSKNGDGYRCICKQGYQGNPYLPQGCRDIDECMDPVTNKCEGSCKNTLGNYSCSCPLGMHGDGKVSCKGFRVTTLAFVIGIFIIFAIIVLFICWKINKRIKERNFLQNGGGLLKHHRVKIFSAAELEKATNNYEELLGQGGSGSVYKGTLADNKEIAVKKPQQEVDKNKIRHFQREVIKQFQHEIEIVSQVNHKNVVKLLGLCLETKAPLLVYEFVSNGTLFQHIHERKSTILKYWKNRLRIAAEIAQALDYLHSLADPPIIHRDIKSMNILLDGNFTAKVSDFGASVLIPLGQTPVATRVLVTYGYLDPEYLLTGDLTAKSDVYSFGVVLIELLTGEKPFPEASSEKRNIIKYFISSIEENRLIQVLRVGDVDRGEMEQIRGVAKLTKRCLNRNGEERPTMKEVAEELLGLMKLHENFPTLQNHEEAESLLAETWSHTHQDGSSFGNSETPFATAIFEIEQD